MMKTILLKKNGAGRISSLAAMAALFLGCAIITVPLRTGSAQPVETTRQIWTAADAAMAQEVADGVPLKDIINSSVKSGASINETIAAAIKVGVYPSLVVYTSINEGYAAQTVVKAALKAGAPFDVVLKAAANAGLNKKSVTVGDVVTAAIKSGVDPSLVVHTAISEGYPAQIVIKTALRAGAPLNVVVKSAIDAGAEIKAVYAGAADAGKAGKSPAAVERAISAAGTPVRVADKSERIAEKPVTSPPSEVALTPRSLEPPLAIFGRGGVVLTRFPSLSQTSQVFPIDPLTINPFLALSEAFSDNVFFSADNRKRDAITTITPGVRVKLPFQAHSAELEYYSVITRYNRKEYRFDDISDHHVNAAMDLKFGDRFGMRLSDQFARDHEPRSSSATGNLEVFHTNAASLSAAYRTSDLTRIQIDYTKANWGYVTDHFRDHDEDLIAGTFFYQVLSRTSAFIEYGHRNFTYTEEAADFDSKADTVQAGLIWDLSARTRGTIKAGLAHKDFTSSTRRDVTVIVWSADVRHDLTSDTTVVLTARRSLNEPNRPDIDYFISTGFYAELTHHFIKEWAAVFRGSQVTDAYSALKADRTFLGGAGLTYKAMDWIEFAVDYNWHQRNSSILGKYVEHSTGVTANISF